MPKMKRSIVAVAIATQTIGRQTKQVVGRVEDAVLITLGAALIVVLAGVTRFLL